MGEWDSYSLGDITRFSSGGTPSKDIAEYWGGSIPWISASSMYETNIGKSELNVTALAIGNGTRIAKKGSLLILVRGSMLFNRVPIGIATIDVAFNQDVKALEVNNDISEIFLLFQLISLESRIPINETGIGAGKIDTDHLKHLTVFIPSIKEQQKISDCLSSLDALIAAQADKLDALKIHKKGLMQQLFPSEGKAVPRLRFPEFREAVEWNVATLDDISKIASGGTPNRSKAEYWNGDIPWVSTSLVDFNTIEQANEYITQFGLDNSSAKIFPEGTILMAMYGQGKTRGKVAVLGVDAAINQACAAISVNDGMLSEFVFQNLAGRYEEIRDLSNQGGQENLSAALIKIIPFSYPDVESGEQQKIADCLSSLDALIAAQTEKLDALKTHKKGLMQQLFPGSELSNV